jgi:hypothetical protein
VLPPGAITLQDNEGDDDDEEEGGNITNNGNRNGSGNGEYAGRRSNSSELSGRERNRACWARSVQVTDHVLVNGSAMSIGAFVVWNIRVEALNVGVPSPSMSFLAALQGGGEGKGKREREREREGGGREEEQKQSRKLTFCARLH